MLDFIIQVVGTITGIVLFATGTYLYIKITNDTFNKKHNKTRTYQ